MKVYLIKASAPGPFKEYKKYMGAPPQNIFALAACTPKSIAIEMCDETIDMRPQKKPDADIIVLLFHTPDAIHGYDMADAYRKRGKTVVLGGLHPSFMPEEALTHADAVLIGEVEGIWEELLHDFKAGQLKKTYQRSTPVDIDTLNPYPTDIISPQKYNGLWSVLVSRGCVHRCEYCVVPPFFKGKYRLRPVEQVVAEIKAAPTDWFELHADNLTADRDYAIRLFKALKPLNINWIGESTIKMAEDDELLRLAAESGCKSLLIGIETPSQAALDTSGKGFVNSTEIRDRIRLFHAHKIQISSSMIFGFDTHTKDIFRESMEFCREIEIDEIESVILAPFPGTPLYQRMEKEHRIITHDWSKYDCSNAVFKPKNMTPQELVEGAAWFWNRIHKEPTVPLKQAKRLPSKTTPSIKWKSLLALFIIGASLVLNQYWLWGVFFMVWGINDLKNKRTYLMEDIPRSESPVLYWIVVTMWLSFALWALSYAPLVEDVLTRLPSIAIKAEANTSAQGYATGKLKIKNTHTSKGLTKTINDTDSGMRLTIPSQWETNTTILPGGWLLNAQAPSNRATITCMTFNMESTTKQADFIQFMEKEIQTDLPFVKENGGTQITLNANQKIFFKEYSGSLDDESLKAIIGYEMEGLRGVVIIGVHGKGDSLMRTAILQGIKSFKNNNK